MQRERDRIDGIAGAFVALEQFGDIHRYGLDGGGLGGRLGAVGNPHHDVVEDRCLARGALQGTDKNLGNLHRPARSIPWLSPTSPSERLTEWNHSSAILLVGFPIQVECL